MKKKSAINIFNSTNALKILSFLAENPGKDFLGNEIQNAASLSRVGTYLALKDLTKQGLVIKTQKGKFFIYSLAHDDPTAKQFKILSNILYLKPVMAKLTPNSKKIILYGSASRGEDFSDSDIDLFVLSNDPAQAKEILNTANLKRKIQAIVMSPVELSTNKEKNKVFYAEVDRGIILWEKKE